MANVLKNPKVVSSSLSPTSGSFAYPATIQAASLSKGDEVASRRFLSKIHSAMELKGEASTFNYDKRDVILYNLSMGAKYNDLPLVYEKSDNFSVLPTFGVIPTVSLNLSSLDKPADSIYSTTPKRPTISRL